MKVIVDIPEDMFEWFKNGEIVDEYDKSALKQVFQNGTPLDDVRAEINGLSGFYSQVTGIREMDTVRSVISDVNNIIDNICKVDMRGIKNGK